MNEVADDSALLRRYRAQIAQLEARLAAHGCARPPAWLGAALWLAAAHAHVCPGAAARLRTAVPPPGALTLRCPRCRRLRRRHSREEVEAQVAALRAELLRKDEHIAGLASQVEALAAGREELEAGKRELEDEADVLHGRVSEQGPALAGSACWPPAVLCGR